MDVRAKQMEAVSGEVEFQGQLLDLSEISLALVGGGVGEIVVG